VNILICEDDAGLRALWAEVFGRAGHTVEAVEDSASARKALMMKQFSVMILDLYLGDDTGLSVATLAAYANPDCKIVITTGSTLFPQGELFAMAPSVAAVLRKPVSNQELLAVAEHGFKAAS
jgi:DNA-binding NtrC family response regulator